MFYDKNSEEPWNAFFLEQIRRCVVCIFLEQKKRVKPCVVRNSFSTALFAAEKWRPDNLFLGYTFTERFSY